MKIYLYAGIFVATLIPKFFIVLMVTVFTSIPTVTMFTFITNLSMLLWFCISMNLSSQNKKGTLYVDNTSVCPS
jgi:hypothetical protein